MPETIGQTIGARVKALRRTRGLTQDELADAADVPQGNISRMERGDFQDVFVSTVLNLARALTVDVTVLLQPLTPTPEHPPPPPQPMPQEPAQAAEDTPPAHPTPLSQAQVLAQLQEMKTAGMSLKQLEDRMNQSGIPTFSGHGKWQKGTIGKLLKKYGGTGHGRTAL